MARYGTGRAGYTISLSQVVCGARGGVISDRGVVLWVAQAVSACVGWWWCEDVRWCVGARESWALALAATLVVGGC